MPWVFVSLCMVQYGGKGVEMFLIYLLNLKLNLTSYNLKYTEKHSAKKQHFQLSWTLRF